MQGETALWVATLESGTSEGFEEAYTSWGLEQASKLSILFFANNLYI